METVPSLLKVASGDDTEQVVMPVLTGLRQSPTYLYIKVYCICCIVTLFQASPVSSRIPHIGQTLHLAKHRIINTRLGPRIVPIDEDPVQNTSSAAEKSSVAASSTSASSKVVISPDLLGLASPPSRLRTLFKRWSQRGKDLSRVRALLQADEIDLKSYPELQWDATVRRSSALHPQERHFIQARRTAISTEGNNSLHSFLGLTAGESVHPEDVPLVALGGSGGGYRAMYGFAAFILAAKKSDLWACTTWTAGVSGSCWALAAYYTIAYQNAERLIKHYLATASELAHPMSVYALDTVARSSRGVYFLIGPLIRKAQAGIVGLGIMDLYATLTTTYQLLSREPRARLSRATLQFSKIWTRSGVSAGLEPMPIFTAVRVAPKDALGVRPHADSSLSKGLPPKRALIQHQTSTSQAIAKHHNAPPSAQDETKPNTDITRVLTKTHSFDVLGEPVAKGYFQWFEASPLEIGSADLQAYIPTWAWGRAFVSGHSLDRKPEESLSLILGQCTSAPAGPLTGYISALLASLPKGTVMSRMLLVLNNFVRMKRWERRWGNPIRAGDEPNPFYGLNVRSSGRQLDPPKHGTSVLGIGIDVMHIPRLDVIVSRMLRRSDGLQNGDNVAPTIQGLTRLAKRILSATEYTEWEQLCDAAHDQKIPSSKLKEYLAVRWCAKEAAYKALYPTHVVSWKDLSVHKDSCIPSSKPTLRFSALGLSRHSFAQPVTLHLSVSHDGGYAVANVVAEQCTALRADALPGQSSSDVRPNARAYDWEEIKLGTPTAQPSDSTKDLSSARKDRYDGPQTEEKASENPASWESQGRIRLMDAGMSNNLPNHILARKERAADIIIAFDASSDVQAGSAVRRLHNFADDCHIDLVDESNLFPPNLVTPSASLTDKAREIETRFHDQYAKVFKGTRQQDASTFWLVYCPLLPNSVRPDFDPSTSSFSNSYNLVWTPSQVQTLLDTSQANLANHALPIIKKVMRSVYEQKKAHRLAQAQNKPHEN